MNKQPAGVGAVVLAAGMSRRMGAPKQLLRIAGKALLEHVLANVRASEVQEIVLVLGAAAEELRRKISFDNLKVTVNPDYEQGMGTSLRTGLAALGPRVEGALVVLADQPFVQPRTLNRLITAREETGAQITLPLYRGFRGNPALLDRSVFPEVMSLSGDVGCRAIFGDHTERIQKVEVGDPGILLDMDTEDDLRRVESLKATPELPMFESRGEPAPETTNLVIVGRDAVAQAIGKFGRVLGFGITFVDPFLRLQDFPDADRVLHAMDFSCLSGSHNFFVVASRGQFDEEAVEQAVAAQGRYIGLLANRKRAAEVLNSLRRRGIPEESLARVKAPAGLEIGAASPEEIALSIVAEIVKERIVT
jgi:molybdenum cofactor cytidylyltransferase